MAPGEPVSVEGDLRRAMAAHQQGARAEAADLYRRVLAKEKRNTHALHNFGLLRAETGHLDDAARLLRQAVRFGARSADVHANLGRIYNLSGKHEDALQSYQEALDINPNHQAALLNSAGTLLHLHSPDKALLMLDRALAHDPSLSLALHNRCIALLDLRRFEEALGTADGLLARDAADADAWLKRGTALTGLRRDAEATESYQKVIALRRSAAALTLLGNLKLKQSHINAALSAYDEAIAMDQRYAEAWLGRGNALNGRRDRAAAFDAFDHAYSLKPDLPFLEGSRLMAKLFLCDWTNLRDEIARVRRKVRDGQPVIDPFFFQAVSPSRAEQLLCAQTFVRYTCRPPPVSPTRRTCDHAKIRVAYVSGDFYDHPVAHLSAGVYEVHDRTCFDVFAISTGPERDDAMHRRLIAAFDEFLNAHSLSSDAIAKWIEGKQIDILVNLNGHSEQQRNDVFALRPAPIQVTYLGQPGTMGAPWMDYIIADETLVEEGEQACYSEKIVCLPNSYQPNDRRRPISVRQPNRIENGLPESGFVFCCFNNSFKILPEIFDVWMRLLGAVQGSVLWLEGFNSSAVANLRREAERLGIAAERLVFAPRVPLNEDHLARLRLADLFVDTLPFNAHTTASDALWAGLPVLTCRGSTFAGRVASSLLRAMWLPELITESLVEYEARALTLARDPGRLALIRAKLAANRDICPLFDTERYTRDLEAAYRGMLVQSYRWTA